GRQPTRNRFGICDRRALVSGAERALRDVGLHLSPHAIAGDLSPGQKQLVEIAKALSQDARVLILDEPTSSLSTHEAEILFQRIEELRRRGIAMVYVSHRLGEITRLCPRVHVLRDGKNAGVLLGKEITQDNIIR